MARIFINRLGGRWPSVLAGPGAVPGIRVVYREAVQEIPRVNASQSLDDMKAFGRSAKPGFVGEISCVDDERIAFPVPDGIPHPAPDIPGKMLCIHAYDASVVHHFAQDHD